MLAWAGESGAQVIGVEAGRCVHGSCNFMESFIPATDSFKNSPPMQAQAGECGARVTGGDAGGVFYCDVTHTCLSLIQNFSSDVC